MRILLLHWASFLWRYSWLCLDFPLGLVCRPVSASPDLIVWPHRKFEKHFHLILPATLDHAFSWRWQGMAMFTRINRKFSVLRYFHCVSWRLITYFSHQALLVLGRHSGAYCGRNYRRRSVLYAFMSIGWKGSASFSVSWYSNLNAFANSLIDFLGTLKRRTCKKRSSGFVWQLRFDRFILGFNYSAFSVY